MFCSGMVVLADGRGENDRDQRAGYGAVETMVTFRGRECLELGKIPRRLHLHVRLLAMMHGFHVVLSRTAQTTDNPHEVMSK